MSYRLMNNIFHFASCSYALICLCLTLAFADDSVTAEKPTKDSRSKKAVLEPVAEASTEIWAHRKMNMRFGMEFHSEENYCTKLKATVPFPRDWPEQTVTVLGNQLPNQATYEFRELNSGAIQALINVDALAPNQQLDVIISVEIEKAFIKAPKDPSVLVYPKKTLKDKDVAWYLGDSPFIETKSRQVRDIAGEIRDTNPSNAWAHVEAIYDWVRTNIEYRNGPIRSTKEALKDRYGDCEEMTGVFVALCRASNIPARCVWIPEHCYPEFYLEDANGFGHWFPAQVAGDRQFGQMNEYRPILQKGDRFKIPEQSGMQRYIAETFTCKQRPTGPTAPRIVSVRDLGELIPELEKLKASTEPKAASAVSSGTPTSELDAKESTSDSTQ
jgi:hypothetical protein